MKKVAAALAATAAAAAVALPLGVADAQVANVTATIAVDPPAAYPGTTAEVTAVFTPNGTIGAHTVSITLFWTGGEGTIDATPVSVGSGLSGCSLDGVARSFRCDWTSGLDTPQTLVLTVNVGAGAVPSDPGWELDANAAPAGDLLETLAVTNLAILAPEPTTTTTTTTPPTSVAADAAVTTPQFTG